MTSYLDRISDNLALKLIILGGSLSFAFGVILLGLLNDVLIITPLLFYIPIIVAAYWFPKKAVLFAVSIGGANILIVYLYSVSGHPQPDLHDGNRQFLRPYRAHPRHLISYPENGGTESPVPWCLHLC